MPRPSTESGIWEGVRCSKDPVWLRQTKQVNTSVGNMAAGGRPGASALAFPPAPSTLSSTSCVPGRRPLTRPHFCCSAWAEFCWAQGCQMHFSVGLSWGFMLSEKFPPLPFTRGPWQGLPLPFCTHNSLNGHKEMGESSGKKIKNKK